MFIKYFITIAFLFLSVYAPAQVSVNIPAKSKVTKGRVNVGGTLKLYTNPADTYFNIYIDWDNAQTFKLTIYDAYDALIKEWNESVRESYQHSVDVTQLPEGNYYLIAEGTKGQLYAEFQVTHKK